MVSGASCSCQLSTSAPENSEICHSEPANLYHSRTLLGYRLIGSVFTTWFPCVPVNRSKNTPGSSEKTDSLIALPLPVANAISDTCRTSHHTASALSTERHHGCHSAQGWAGSPEEHGELLLALLWTHLSQH